MVFDIENWFWKSDFNTFWQLITTLFTKYYNFLRVCLYFDLKKSVKFVYLPWKLDNLYSHIVPAPKNLSPLAKHCRLKKGAKQKKMSKFLKDEIAPAVTSYFMYSEIQGSALIEKSAFIIGEKPEVPESILVVAAVVNLVRFFLSNHCMALCRYCHLTSFLT